MNEHELKDALRGVMVAGSPPPPMDGTAALDVARGALRRRRATLAATGSALAIVVIAVAALVVAGPNGVPGGQVGSPVPTPSVSESSDTRTVWPTGPDGKPQQDRTATAGPRADQSVRLEAELMSSLPAGLTAAPPLQPLPPGPGGPPARVHQSQFLERVNGTEVWEYLADMAVIASDGKIGYVAALVNTPGIQLPADLCEAAKTLWAARDENGVIDAGWVCQEMSVGSLKVGVVSEHRSDLIAYQQWAFYRHPDGTAVFIAQARDLRMRGTSARPDRTPLDAQPFTLERLAELAADARFHLT